MGNLEMKEIEAAIEGILFASGEPIHVDRIAVALEMDRQTVEQVLQRLADYYAYERRGIRLLRIREAMTAYEQNYINDIDKDQLSEILAQAYLYGTGDRFAAYYSAEEWAVLKVFAVL